MSTLSFIRALAHLEATGATIMFDPYESKGDNGEIVYWPLEGRRISFSDQPHPRRNVIHASTLVRAIRMKHLRIERRRLRDPDGREVFSNIGTPLFEYAVHAVLTDAGKAYLDKHREILEKREGDDPGYLVLRRGTAAETEYGPLMRIVYRTAKRFYVDRDWKFQGDVEFDTRVVGYGTASYVAIHHVAGIFDHPDQYADLKGAQTSLRHRMRDSHIAEAAEVEAAVGHIRKRRKEERERITSSGLEIIENAKRDMREP